MAPEPVPPAFERPRTTLHERPRLQARNGTERISAAKPGSYFTLLRSHRVVDGVMPRTVVETRQLATGPMSVSILVVGLRGATRSKYSHQHDAMAQIATVAEEPVTGARPARRRASTRRLRRLAAVVVVRLLVFLPGQYNLHRLRRFG